MGIYLNPGNKSFWESIHSEIYVDKTGLIAHTNKCIHTEQKYMCVSRPRRFGKSMALKMLLHDFPWQFTHKQFHFKDRERVAVTFCQGRLRAALRNWQQNARRNAR